MEDREPQTALKRAAALLRQARYAVALTGAGSSTPSGIPDFRTPGKGLWEKDDPMEVASIYAFRRNPEAFYLWVRPLIHIMRSAQPNPAHLALARLEAAGRLKVVLTQNIDGLHQRAGSRHVLELHGHLRTVTCLDCFQNRPAEEVLEAIERREVPRCPACGGVLKPDVILFGEQLHADVLTSAMEHVHRADLMLVVGSSLLVMPAANLPALVHANGGEIIICNKQTTYADAFAVAVFHGDAAQVLPRLTQACLEESQ
ncbi:MAG TPA: NAD-dependent deacylase [Anaerolineae bacterium]|nr:NAD-dependent deacylase [Anaerolineae bacterium]